MPQHETIIVRGAREHNLKNIDVEIPRDKLVVITGLSGSGKSSLAFDTIYAEGQRRYVESLSAYARQFLGQMEKPDVDYIEGLSPAISIDQKGASRNPRSTVGTVTEIYDYLRLLFARVGRPHCPNCGRPIAAQTVQQIVDAILGAARRHAADGPRPGHPRPQGRAPGRLRGRPPRRLRPRPRRRRRSATSTRRSTLDQVQEAHHRGRRRPPRHPPRARRRRPRRRIPIAVRVIDSVETALKLGERHRRRASIVDGERAALLRALRLPLLRHQLRRDRAAQLLLQQPHGACPTAPASASTMEIDPELVVPNRDLSIWPRARSSPWVRSRREAAPGTPRMLEALAEQATASRLDVPVARAAAEAAARLLLYGNDGEHGHRHATRSSNGRTAHLRRRPSRASSPT